MDGTIERCTGRSVTRKGFTLYELRGDGRSAVTHGLRATYKLGCRCVRCRAANAAYIAALRQQHAQGKRPLGHLVNAKEAGQHVRAILVERYTRQILLEQTGLERHTLPKLTATHLCRLKTLLILRHTYRKLVGTDDAADTQAS